VSCSRNGNASHSIDRTCCCIVIDTPLRSRLAKLADPSATFDNLLAMLVSILLGMKRGPTNFVKVGSLTQRIACRLIARRQAEIRLNWGEKPVEPGDQGRVVPITDAESAAQDRTAIRRLKKGAASTRSQGGRGKECPRLGETNIVNLWPRPRGQAAGASLRVWGSVRAPADDYHCSDLAASGPRIDLTLRYVRRCSVPIAGIPADLLAAHTLPPADCMLSKCGK
jgi:hypothetical protein